MMAQKQEPLFTAEGVGHRGMTPVMEIQMLKKNN